MGKSVLSKHLAEIGRKGGKARLTTMTPEQRRAVASKGGQAFAAKAKAKRTQGK